MALKWKPCTGTFSGQYRLCTREEDAVEKKDKKILRYCVECGQEIQDWEGYEEIETKRKRVIYVHRKCLRRKGRMPEWND